jgi:hypothetical protein
MIGHGVGLLTAGLQSGKAHADLMDAVQVTVAFQKF